MENFSGYYYDTNTKKLIKNLNGDYNGNLKIIKSVSEELPLQNNSFQEAVRILKRAKRIILGKNISEQEFDFLTNKLSIEINNSLFPILKNNNFYPTFEPKRRMKFNPALVGLINYFVSEYKEYGEVIINRFFNKQKESIIKSVVKIDCSYNERGEKLIYFPRLRGFDNLEDLDCKGNLIKNLEIESLTKLKNLNFNNNKISSNKTEEIKNHLEFLEMLRRPFTNKCFEDETYLFDNNEDFSKLSYNLEENDDLKTLNGNQQKFFRDIITKNSKIKEDITGNNNIKIGDNIEMW